MNSFFRFEYFHDAVTTWLKSLCSQFKQSAEKRLQTELPMFFIAFGEKTPVNLLSDIVLEELVLFVKGKLETGLEEYLSTKVTSQLLTESTTVREKRKELKQQLADLDQALMLTKS